MPFTTHPIILHVTSLLTDIYTIELPNELIPSEIDLDAVCMRIMDTFGTIEEWPNDRSPEVSWAKMFAIFHEKWVAGVGQDEGIDFDQFLDLLQGLMPQTIRAAISGLPPDVQAAYYSNYSNAVGARLSPNSPTHNPNKHLGNHIC